MLTRANRGSIGSRASSRANRREHLHPVRAHTGNRDSRPIKKHFGGISIQLLQYQNMRNYTTTLDNMNYWEINFFFSFAIHFGGMSIQLLPYQNMINPATRLQKTLIIGKSIFSFALLPTTGVTTGKPVGRTLELARIAEELAIPRVRRRAPQLGMRSR